ncbi:hypothetical protein COY62_01845 [bacterium (Candidatus Howlettbacteria) CG_4_10_14_0_8_um_filter_40_9]|nr:MAG: hypothetical protein COY62_01845 [bacterium (Candidatus Howlettbacteria) CG_4_10_14_0_8_um_filter_40_9]
MKKEKTTKALAPKASFLKQLFTNKWFLAGIGGLLIFILLSFIFIYNPMFVPEEIKGANKEVIDKVIGEDLSAKIDETRDENGATTIRNIFNSNKEENEERHCEDKEEREQEQDKCETLTDDDTEPGKKIYRNDEFGYSVKVPKEWDIYKTNNGAVSFAKQADIEQLKADEIKYTDTDVPYTYGKVISINVIDKSPEYQTAEDYAKKYLLSLDGSGYVKNFETKFNVNGFYVYDKGPNRFGGGSGEYFVAEHYNKFYEISLDHAMLVVAPDIALSSIFNDILLNFKF